MFYYGYTNIHDAILGFDKFSKLSLPYEVRCDLLKSVLYRHNYLNGPLKPMFDAANGNMDLFISM